MTILIRLTAGLPVIMVLLTMTMFHSLGPTEIAQRLKRLTGTYTINTATFAPTAVLKRESCCFLWVSFSKCILLKFQRNVEVFNFKVRMKFTGKSQFDGKIRVGKQKNTFLWSSGLIYSLAWSFCYIFVYSTFMRGFQQRSRCLKVSGTSGGISKISPSLTFSDESCSGSLVAGIFQNNTELQNDCIMLFLGFVSKSDAVFPTHFKVAFS